MVATALDTAVKPFVKLHSRFGWTGVACVTVGVGAEGVEDDGVGADSTALLGAGLVLGAVFVFSGSALEAASFAAIALMYAEFGPSGIEDLSSDGGLGLVVEGVMGVPVGGGTSFGTDVMSLEDSTEASFAVAVDLIDEVERSVGFETARVSVVGPGKDANDGVCTAGIEAGASFGATTLADDETESTLSEVGGSDLTVVEGAGFDSAGAVALLGVFSMGEAVSPLTAGEIDATGTGVEVVGVAAVMGRLTLINVPSGFLIVTILNAWGAAGVAATCILKDGNSSPGK